MEAEGDLSAHVSWFKRQEGFWVLMALNLPM